MKRRRFCILFKKEEPVFVLSRLKPVPPSRAPFMILQSHTYSHYFSPKNNPSLHYAAVCLTIAACVSRSCSTVVPLSCSSPAPGRPSLARQGSSPASRHLWLSLISLVTALAEGNASDAPSVLGAFS
ncbi:hypothetical protein HN51_021584 [Arachis hypogaea]|nr:uncharacterized protein DS421_2g41330 [Arachis hypogaea]